MAIVYATKAGNWSDTTVWSSGTLPASTDDVYANNFAVTVNQSITVNSLKNISNASPVIAAGGSFQITTAVTITITNGVLASDQGGSGGLLLNVNAGSAAVTITATNNGFTANATNFYRLIQVASGYTGTLTVNGNQNGGSAAGASAVLYNAATAACTIVCTGTLVGGSSNGGGPAFNNSGPSANITITGDVKGHSAQNNPGFQNNGASSSITINGNVLGDAAGIGLSNTANSSTFTISGNVVGGSTANTTHGIQDTSTTGSSYNVSGYIAGGSAGSTGITATGSITVRGNFRPGNYTSGRTGSPALNNTGVSTRISGHIYPGNWFSLSGPAGYFPISGSWCAISGEELYIHIFDDNGFPAGNGGTQRVLVRYGPNNPAASDVRSGVTYGASGALVGTLAVPPAASVASGVAVDNTTGTAALKLADVAAVQGNQIAAVFP